MIIKVMTAKEEAIELLTALRFRKGIQIDSFDIEIMTNIVTLLAKAAFQEGSGIPYNDISQVDAPVAVMPDSG